MKISNLLSFILFVNVSYAQQIATAKIEKVNISGLHQILIPVELRSFTNQNLSDFRIFDSKGLEVPYFVNSENNKNIQNTFVVFKITSKVQVPNKNTTIIFENAIENLNGFELEVSNSNIEKKYSVLGSDDNKNWYGITENQNILAFENLVSISIPITKFKLIKIVLDDKKSLPINILKIGYTKGIITNSDWTEIKPVNLFSTQNIPEKKTKIELNFKNNVQIDWMKFKVSSPNFYNRNCVFYVNKSEIYKRKKVNLQKTIIDFNLKSNSTNSIEVNSSENFLKNQYYIEIFNEDNPSLVFSEIKFFQKALMIVADLKTNENYSIQVGNKKLNYPNYDLQYFEKEISNNLPSAKITEIKLQSLIKNATTEKNDKDKPWFMWICIIFGGLTILYFTSKLVKDMKNNS